MQVLHPAGCLLQIYPDDSVLVMGRCAWDYGSLVKVLSGHMMQLPITKWPRQSGAPVGAAPPTRSQLRLQRHTQVPVQDYNKRPTNTAPVRTNKQPSIAQLPSQLLG